MILQSLLHCYGFLNQKHATKINELLNLKRLSALKILKDKMFDPKMW